MAGHSQFKNIMYRKGAQDKKRAKEFSRLAREISVAARSGPDPTANPALRTAIANARSANMPKDNIERAVLKATGGDSDNYEEVRYEGFGPGGVSVIVEALTDNRNRTAGDVRTIFSKHGGSLGETGSATHMFELVGLMTYSGEAGDSDTVFEAALEAGADDCRSDENGHEITCAPDAFNEVRDALEASLGEPREARLSWKPQITVEISEGHAETLFKLLNALDDNDDVQRVYANFEVSEDILEKLSA